MEVATMLSEVDRRIAEAKKDMYEFKRDIIGTTAPYSPSCFKMLLPQSCLLLVLIDAAQMRLAFACLHLCESWST